MHFYINVELIMPNVIHYLTRFENLKYFCQAKILIKMNLMKILRKIISLCKI